MINRSCAAVFNWNKTKVIMVKHCEGEREYWTLPGGGIDKGETPEQCAIREFKEEVNIDIKIEKELFEDKYLYKGVENTYKCFLGKKKLFSKIKLGFDPEEINVNKENKMLRCVMWLDVKKMKNDLQIKKVIEKMNKVEK